MTTEVERRVAELRRLVRADPNAAAEAGGYLAGRFREELAKLAERRNRDKEDLSKLIEIGHAMHSRQDEMCALSERVIDPADPPAGWTWLNAQVREDGRPPVWQEEIYRQLGRVDREACDLAANIAGHIRNAERGRCGQLEGRPLSDISTVEPIDAYVHGLWLHSRCEGTREELKQHVLEGDPLAEPRARFRALGEVIRHITNIRTKTALGPTDAWRIGVLYLTGYDPSFDPDAVGFANLTPWGPPETEVDEAAALPEAFVERRELCEIAFGPADHKSAQPSTLEERFEALAARAVIRLSDEQRRTAISRFEGHVGDAPAASESDPPAKRRRGPRRSQDEKQDDELRIARRLSENPEITLQQLADAVQLAKGTVQRSQSWRSHMHRRREAARKAKAAERGMGGVSDPETLNGSGPLMGTTDTPLPRL